MKRVFIYCRVSTAQQTDGDGFDRQERVCREFAARNGWGVLRVFKEQQTGSDEWMDRKLLSEAMELASHESFVAANVVPVNGRNCGSATDSGVTDTIIVERADRLSRDLIVSELFLKACKQKGVKVYAADSGAELVNGDGNPTQTLIRQVLGAVAQFDKASIVQKMQAGRRATALKTGKPCGGRTPNPYGDRGNPAQRSRERQIIRHILDLRSQGLSMEKIAKRLRDARVPTPHGDNGRRIAGVNPAWQWSYKIVSVIVRDWSDRADL